jgi:hypothetical protein
MLPVGCHAAVDETGVAPFHDRRTRRQRRQQGQQQPGGGMQTRKLGVAGEGQIQVHALQVGPAVLPRIEDAVVSAVDLGMSVRPQPRFGDPKPAVSFDLFAC